jgi:hypothetical protein
VKARFAIIEVLNHIVGRITDEWLRVDHKPRLSLGPQNISRVKIGGKKRIGRRWLPERLKDLQSFVHHASVRPVLSLVERFLAPGV